MKETLDNHKEFVDQTILKPIARKHLFIEYWETRDSDSLDFHDIHILSVHGALRAAFEAGRNYQFNLRKP